MADTEAEQKTEEQTEVKLIQENEEQEESIDTEEWKLDKYRLKVVERIQDEITKHESEVPKTATELEDFAYTKAKSKRTYLDLIARILVYVAEFNRKKEEKEAAESAKTDEVTVETSETEKEEAAES